MGICELHYHEAESKCIRMVAQNDSLHHLTNAIRRKLRKKQSLWSRKTLDFTREEEKLQYSRLCNQIRESQEKTKKLMENEIAKYSNENKTYGIMYRQN